MLAMRPDCERCGRDLPPQVDDAFICSFECTFCSDCAGGPLAGCCPNCGGDLRPRPTRAAHLLERFPASTERKHQA
ncbi:DUF1272 domain-containing protein [Sphingomonas colocasiae]|uniref:DUF1272 domain-containing protein n=1 Tax=Sphingomonas colocasiae TaxID=1848973 RepID=A0ABS7PY67_9SPHN|nr:DUF1272 domain-containing protein [Sphingomonas colocasiae]MBY8826301.1 DUF1272 domain-containing protein [Sphingomonas colocasiae]